MLLLNFYLKQVEFNLLASFDTFVILKKLSFTYCCFIEFTDSYIDFVNVAAISYSEITFSLKLNETPFPNTT